MLNVVLKEGLGDSIAAAACLQLKSFNEKITINYVGHPALREVLKYHPTIKWSSETQSDSIYLKWASSVKENIWPLHIKQKYSYQLGFFIEPTYCLNYYNEYGNIIKNQATRKLVLINTLSNAPGRRNVPRHILEEVILPELDRCGYTWKFIGSHYNTNTNTNVIDCINELSTASLYIGPVSGMSFVAEMLNIKRIIFCSCVPYYRDMSCKNLYPVMMDQECIYDCEYANTDLYKQMQCNDRVCNGTFSKDKVLQVLKGVL